MVTDNVVALGIGIEDRPDWNRTSSELANAQLGPRRRSVQNVPGRPHRTAGGHKESRVCGEELHVEHVGVLGRRHVRPVHAAVKRPSDCPTATAGLANGQSVGRALKCHTGVGVARRAHRTPRAAIRGGPQEPTVDSRREPRTGGSPTDGSQIGRGRRLRRSRPRCTAVGRVGDVTPVSDGHHLASRDGDAVDRDSRHRAREGHSAPRIAAIGGPSAHPIPADHNHVVHVSRDDTIQIDLP